MRSDRYIREWKRGLPIYAMILPGFLFFLIFKYVPMAGLVIAFQEFDPFAGVVHSPWVGFEHFHRLFTDPDFWTLFRNTLILSGLNLLFFFPAPIVVAVLLNEVGRAWFRRSAQTILYMPHFLSWVIVVTMTLLLFGTQDGGINNFLEEHGFNRIELLTDPSHLRPLYLMQNIWKEAGWNAIIFLASLAAVDPTLYEAAVADGAGRWRQMWHITLPALKSTIVILFILRLGHVMEIGFEHILLLQNPINLDVSNVFDTYVYHVGIAQGQFSYTTAVGIFKSVIALILIIIANRLAKSLGEEGAY
ncbi:ABC transporter permease subunit [Paenibacillus sp. HB172176]|uniref:ABC transporter permease n=1 Tax=Paenibacillus sp. HB172176 TaxID=2493690 RepID=UPI001439073C|nr:ABC transporter permease subunit [Paenibacillus sp. HB172176]